MSICNVIISENVNDKLQIMFSITFTKYEFIFPKIN